MLNTTHAEAESIGEDALKAYQGGVMALMAMVYWAGSKHGGFQAAG